MLLSRFALISTLIIPLANAESYSEKAAAVNARLNACQESSNALDECIDAWSETFKSYNLPKAKRMSDSEKKTFSANIEKIIALNSKTPDLTWVADLNAFSHWTLEKFSKSYLSGNITMPSSDMINYRIEKRAVDLPESIDWSLEQFGTEAPLFKVKNQGKQGTSW